ncbi:4,5-DOPA dioxygenase extradiol [Aeromonas salmonicida]|uniref:DODA-type extradiol aromatic ring-opening family dioxygenase n=1 Tax=Aeromonas salmonicida TaxID=645 RepID=UPI0028604D34|nr:class III extradiol ring-cleavage dioxygenase [Aeromonas salmonicida]MDR6995430.1 4,5-DOPA dioxygenase extradiol [Aeromonas salmonicida]
MSIAPVWFISHGAPDLVLRDQPATHFLKTLHLGDIKGLVVISAHWFSRTDLQINVEPNPALMYDFYGFPEPLYHIRWPATSPLWLQEAVGDQLMLAGLPATQVRRELDHGVWSPLSLMDPASEIPLVQISIPASFSPAQLWQLGEALQSLREQGIGILASGAITHNLQALGPDHSPVPGWASAFVNWLEQTMSEGDRPALEEYRTRAPGAVEAHPHDDHLRPLFVALGAAGKDKPHKLHDSWDGGSLYMGSYRFG